MLNADKNCKYAKHKKKTMPEKLHKAGALEDYPLAVLFQWQKCIEILQWCPKLHSELRLWQVV